VIKRFFRWLFRGDRKQGEMRQATQLVESSYRRLARAEQGTEYRTACLAQATDELNSSVSETMRSVRAWDDALEINREARK